MHIRKAWGMPNQKPLKSFTFIDTITRFGNMVVKEDLESAYIRAGSAVNGNMRQNFVVLHDGQTFQAGKNAGTSCSSGPTGSGRVGATKGGGQGYRF